MHVSLYEHELHRVVASPVIFLFAHSACAVHTHSLSSPHTNLQHFLEEALGSRVSENQPGAEGSGGVETWPQRTSSPFRQSSSHTASGAGTRIVFPDQATSTPPRPGVSQPTAGCCRMAVASACVDIRWAWHAREKGRSKSTT